MKQLKCQNSSTLNTDLLFDNLFVAFINQEGKLTQNHNFPEKDINKISKDGLHNYSRQGNWKHTIYLSWSFSD